MKLFNFIDNQYPHFFKNCKIKEINKIYDQDISYFVSFNFTSAGVKLHIIYILFNRVTKRGKDVFFEFLMEDINNQFKEIYFNSRCFWVFGCKIPVKNTRIAKGVLILFLIRYFWSNIPLRGGRCMNTTKLLSRLNIWKCWS